MSIRRRWFSCRRRLFLSLTLGLAIAVSLSHTPGVEAAIRQCGAGNPYTIYFVDGASADHQTKRCNNWFCFEAIDLAGPWIRLKNPACDPNAGACTIQVGMELEFPGNEQNVAMFSTAGPWIYWYDTESPNQACAPGVNVDCGQIGSCGVPGASATITTDTVETYVEIGGVSCGDTSSALLKTYSLSAFACYFSDPPCAKPHHVPGIDATPGAVKQALGCPIIPTQSCNGDDGTSCRDCLAGGVGIGGGLGIGGSGGFGDPATGHGAYLYYTAGGPGHVGLPGAAAWRVTLGRHWSHSYAQRIVPDPDEGHVWLITEHGTFREWSALDTMTGVYQSVAPSNEYRTLTWTGSGWTLEELDGTVHAFDGGGLWTSTTDRNANGGLNAKVASYVGGVLDHVTFPDDTREDFAYYPAGDSSEGKLESITVVGVDGTTGRTWTYHWTGDDLVRIDRPDGTAVLYTYGDARFPGYLTRITLEGTDGTSTRVERAYEYDANHNVIASWAGDVSKAGPDAVDLWQLAFDDPTNPTVTTVTDPLNKDITYHLEHEASSTSIKVTSIAGDCPVCGLGPNVTLGYDDTNHPLLPTATTDGRGFATTMSYDAHGQLTSRTEADSTPEMRTTTWAYDATYPGLVTSMEVPSVAGGGALRTTEWLRDTFGNPTTRRITGVEAGSAFSTEYDTVTSFNGAGQPLTVDPPGHAAADQTTWSYTPPSAGDPDRGELFPFTRTDPLIGDTVFTYDPFNRRASVTDPNGVKTQTSYDDLDRVTEVRQLLGSTPQTGDLVTEYKYNRFRDLSQTILPRGNVIEYGYDPAGRLISIERKPDDLPETHGERTFYTLNEAGNRTREEQQVWDADSAQWVTLSATEYLYSNRCQVDQVVQAPGMPEEAVTDYSYDCNGNLEKVWDPNHPRFDPVTSDELLETALYQYDAFNRLTSVTQPWGGAGGGFAVTSYDYDVQDHLTQVTDAEGNVSTYTYSDRDLLTEEISPVGDQSAKINFIQAKGPSPAPRDQPVATAAATLAATTAYEYDPHGELIQTTDPRGVIVTRIVDALDRVTRVEYPGTALDVDYDYDIQPAACGGTSFPLGRLGSITRDGQAVELCYDRFGRTTRDGELTYGYDDNGNRSTIGYPGSVQASIMYDLVADRPESLTANSPGGTEPVVTAASYLPAGPLSRLALGSGSTETRAFDGRYAPTAIGLSGDPAGVGDHTWSYTTDPVGNVLEIVERGVCADAPRVLTAQTVTTTETFTSCSDLVAGGGFTVDSPGNVTFEAQGTVILTDGFSVLSGASFTAGSAGAPELLPPELRLPGRPVLPDRRRRPLARGPGVDLRPDRQPPHRDPHPARRHPGHRHLSVPHQRRDRQQPGPRPGQPRHPRHPQLHLGRRRQPRPGRRRRQRHRLRLRRREPPHKRRPRRGRRLLRLPLRRPQLPQERRRAPRRPAGRNRLRPPPLQLRRPTPGPAPQGHAGRPRRARRLLLLRRPPRRPDRHRRHRHRDLDLPHDRPPGNAAPGDGRRRSGSLERRLRTLRDRLAGRHSGRGL